MSDHLIPKTKPPELLRVLSTYDIDVTSGRVFSSKGYEFCAKDKEGRVYCSVYCKALQKTFTMARYHIIWWKATKEWPTQLVDHIDDIPFHDWFNNLQYLSHRQNIIKGIENSRRKWLISTQGNSRPWNTQEEKVNTVPYGSPWLTRKE